MALKERLPIACRRIVWLDPLLRYDRFVPAHNLASLEQLARLPARPSRAEKVRH